MTNSSTQKMETRVPDTLVGIRLIACSGPLIRSSPGWNGSEIIPGPPLRSDCEYDKGNAAPVHGLACPVLFANLSRRRF